MVEETCERDFSSAPAFELKLFIDFLLLSWKLVYTYNILCVLMLFIVCEDHECVTHVDHLFNCHLCTAEVKIVVMQLLMRFIPFHNMLPNPFHFPTVVIYMRTPTGDDVRSPDGLMEGSRNIKNSQISRNFQISQNMHHRFRRP